MINKTEFIGLRVTPAEKKQIIKKMKELKIYRTTDFFRYLWNRFGK